jgi:hypothetical protein
MKLYYDFSLYNLVSSSPLKIECEYLTWLGVVPRVDINSHVFQILLDYMLKI